MVGRPTTYSHKRAQRFLDAIANGATLNDACSSPTSPSRSAIYRWLHKHSEFRNSYDMARAERAQAWAEEIIDIAENTSGDLLPGPGGGLVQNDAAIQRDRLRVDTRKWLMARSDPKRFGDRQHHEITSTETLALRVEAPQWMQERLAARAANRAPMLDGQVVDMEEAGVPGGGEAVSRVKK